MSEIALRPDETAREESYRKSGRTEVACGGLDVIILHFAITTHYNFKLAAKY